MRVSVAAAAALFATGCLSIPDYQGTDQIAGVRVDGATVHIGADWALTFGTMSGFPFHLVRTNADDEQLLAYVPQGDTAFLDGVGVALLPRFGVNDHSFPGAFGFTGGYEVVASGPAKAVVDVTWSVDGWPPPLTDPPTPPGPASRGNLSRFSFYPDGRISRHDVIHGQPADDVQLTSYWSLSRFSFSRSAHQYGPQPSSDNGLETPITLEGIDATTGWTCVQRDEPGDRLAGLTWRVPTASPFRGVAMDLGNYPTAGSSLVTMRFDWVVSGTVEAIDYIADTALYLRTSGTCIAVMPELAAEYEQTESPLAAAVFRPDDGVYVVGPGAHAITRTIPRGAALEIAAPAGVDLELDGTPLAANLDYLQQADAGTTTVWIAVPLGGGSTLTITARP